jgi:hypothetical protein
MLQYNPFKVENIAKQQNAENFGNIRNTRDVTFFNKDESMTSGSFLSSYFTIHGDTTTCKLLHIPHQTMCGQWSLDVSVLHRKLAQVWQLVVYCFDKYYLIEISVMPP